MTKRDLVKWLEKEKVAALEVAKERRKKMIEQAEEAAYASIWLHDFIDKLSNSFSQIVDQYNDLFKRCAESDKITCHTFHWKLSYSEFKHFVDDPEYLSKEVKEMISINSDDYNQAKRQATLYYNNVESTYDNVIQTVKNLPTAKDGIEYLKKLGFDVSKILPVETKKQLPATISVNVDTRYLIFNKE